MFRPIFIACAVFLMFHAQLLAASLIGEIRDSESGQFLPARIYVQDQTGKWFFPESAHKDGSAVRYQKQSRGNTNSVEMHTTLSAHPFRVELPIGKYTLTVERGKEYFTLIQDVEVKGKETRVKLPLKRWINMAERGWYSGDTHVHRTLEELPNLMRAEDLNVSFPLVYWVTRAYESPSTGNKNLGGNIPSGLIKLDSTHVIYPRNTEYEIFSVNRKRHALGAIFVLNHKQPFQMGAPPVTPIAEQARAEGALLELDKHNWEWSMMLVPVMNVDLFELSNNHVWRTEFGFRNFGLEAPNYMGLNPKGQWTERDWLLYGFKNYYALLNSGFPMRVAAGNASGVHPVPLGFGRVYVNLPDGFDYDDWVNGLNAGRSFVTTGPMLFATIDGKPAGTKTTLATGKSLKIAGELCSDHMPGGVEIMRNGEAIIRIASQPEQREDGSFRFRFETNVKVEESSWIALRYIEHREGGRLRFAHTNPWHFSVTGKPLRPKKREIEFLIGRMKTQIQRSTGVLPEKAMAEYQRALAVYQSKLANAR
ncbi:MAG: hypothetical protein CMO80_00395 [Verrucomicrobiales bacterium]|nr:hypothetical protein [Verrucomicrobiales bacterium]